MDLFSQLVLLVGRVTPAYVQLLGTGFLIREDGLVATTFHVIGTDPSQLVVLAPHISNLNAYQDLSDTSCQTIPAQVKEIDPVRDLAILKTNIRFSGMVPRISGFDQDDVGSEIHIFGFPHCTEGRRALTFHRSEIGAKVILPNQGAKIKHAVINAQARPGQSGSMIYSPNQGAISGVLIGAWIPGPAGAIISGINPSELHQTTQCISAEYLNEML
jgi:hypothetical protein